MTVHLPRPRLRVLGWIILAGLTGYALSWAGVSLSVLAMTTSARASEQSPRPAPIPGVRNFAHVDAHLWRGGAPTAEGYRELAARGVRTVVDLRAEELPAQVRQLPIKAGLTVVHMPIRDGQVPTAAQVSEFLATVRNAQDPVFVHCGAGVGRTGSMSAAYLVATGQADAAEATLRSLAVGPPTMEQIAFMRGLKGHQVRRPSAVVVAFSRIADSPRRSWSRLGL